MTDQLHRNAQKAHLDHVPRLVTQTRVDHNLPCAGATMAKHDVGCRQLVDSGTMSALMQMFVGKGSKFETSHCQAYGAESYRRRGSEILANGHSRPERSD
jgi:hypothetical protein